MKELPKGIVAGTLNQKTRRHERGRFEDDRIPRLHVSSLIKSGPQDFFCERENVLNYMERRGSAGGGLPPKFALLFAVGHFYGDYMVQEFLAKNPDWAQYAWGNWRCICGHETRIRQCTPVGEKCSKCEHPVDRYVEVDLFNPAKTVVGHADLIFCVDGRFYVYEFKSIERADVVFEEINEPLGDHLTQASNYYYMLKGEGLTVSRMVRFVYVDRSMAGLYTTLPFREVEGEAIPQHRLRNFYIRAKVTNNAIRKGILPARKCETIDCTRAKNCKVATSCFARTGKTIKRLTDIQLGLTPLSPPSVSTPAPKVRPRKTIGGDIALVRRRPRTTTPVS
jgi:hypothetical protein